MDDIKGSPDRLVPATAGQDSGHEKLSRGSSVLSGRKFEISGTSDDEPLISLVGSPDTAVTKRGESGALPQVRTHYYNRMSGDLTDRIYASLVDKITKGHRYREMGITAKMLADEMGVSQGYISATLRRHGNANFKSMVNALRLRDACKMLRSPRYANRTIEEISLLVGFASRQAFHKAFSKIYVVSPSEYREGLDR